MKMKLSSKVILAIMTLYLLLPFLITFVYSLFSEWTSILPHGLTLSNYIHLFQDQEFLYSIGRTLFLCFISVILTLILLILALYATLFIKPIRTFMQIVCMLPYALQGVILSISIISLYNDAPFIFSNRLMMLIGAYSIITLPYLYQGLRNRLNSMNAYSYIEAARVLHCSQFKAYLKVILPLMKNSFIVAGLLAQSIIFGDFVLANNIVGTNFLNVQVYLNKQMRISSGLSSAVVVIIFIIVFLITFIVLRIQRKEDFE